MWPFKKTKKKQNRESASPDVNYPIGLTLLRYTYDTFQKVFPTKTKEQWEEVNCPNDVAKFVKYSVARTQVELMTPIQYIQIATIDYKFIDWAEKLGYTDFALVVRQYVTEHNHVENYWDERLFESGMINSYNILGIPSMFMVGNVSNNKSELYLDEASTNLLTEQIKHIYSEDEVFVPGWITKGSDMPTYTDDIVQIAEETWQNKKKIRFGKYLEQAYTERELEDKFRPLYFVVPFLIKVKVQKSKIDLFTQRENDKTSAAFMSAKMFTQEQRIELLDVISSQIKEVVSVGTSAVMPGQAYLSYNVGLSHNKNIGKIFFNF